MLNHNALGLTCRTGGIDDIRQVARVHADRWIGFRTAVERALRILEGHRPPGVRLQIRADLIVGDGVLYASTAVNITEDVLRAVEANFQATSAVQ